MGRLAIVLVAFTACYRPAGFVDCQINCGLCPDGLVCGASGRCSESGMACNGDDGYAPEAGTNQVCFGTPSLAQTFCVPTPTSPASLPPMIDTDTDICSTNKTTGCCYPNITAACVVAGTSMTITNEVRGVGSRPLVLAATGTIEIAALVDVSSLQGSWQPRGAGALVRDDTKCGVPLIHGGVDSEFGIGGGGAGGSFGGSGSDGGRPAMNGARFGTAIMPLQEFPATLRGGCAGGLGGQTNVGAGYGGGALYVVAGERVHLLPNARLAAMGESAAGNSMVGSGGCGGGSGGLILVEANRVIVDAQARILALGGSGASGAGANQTGVGGSSPTPTNQEVDQIMARGGLPPAMSHGGTGSDGSSLGNADSIPSSSADGTLGGGGGGGGGGSGFIRIVCSACTVDSTLVAPTPAIIVK